LVVKLAPGAKLGRSFLLAAPTRLVMDLEGLAPKRSYSLDPKMPWVDRVRIGRQGSSTRVVLDLAAAPSDLERTPGGAVLSFAP
jgi:hypothetical protein